MARNVTPSSQIYSPPIQNLFVYIANNTEKEDGYMTTLLFHVPCNQYILFS
jgi:hypothetical protein